MYFLHKPNAAKQQIYNLGKNLMLMECGLGELKNKPRVLMDNKMVLSTRRLLMVELKLVCNE